MLPPLRHGSRGIAAVLLATLAAAPAYAHHGWSTYDDSKPVTLTGKLVEVNYQNPHATVRIDANGKRWLAVLAPISRMQSRGATADKVAVGKQVTLVGYPSKEHDDEMRAERIVLDGQTVELR
ncbi:hypothetical protein L602_001900000840 [Cupriavidus gilardii J11]|uniref:Cu/Ag efflux protein CusF n=1 Tax=Cupriavidus gilardii J11 TaxID=936133 RepID=A0A562BPK2_9BURK|nr:DUF6152 family protein [Cupriavidus gilardii]TWG87081.1 hypothetical protein L602_001900000840 [Cupriavidus gilardii J11]